MGGNSGYSGVWSNQKRSDRKTPRRNSQKYPLLCLSLLLHCLFLCFVFVCFFVRLCIYVFVSCLLAHICCDNLEPTLFSVLFYSFDSRGWNHLMCVHFVQCVYRCVFIFLLSLPLFFKALSVCFILHVCYGQH